MGQGKVLCFMLTCCIVAPPPPPPSNNTKKKIWGRRQRLPKIQTYNTNTKDNFVLINTISLYFCESISYVNTDEHGNLKSGITD